MTWVGHNTLNEHEQRLLGMSGVEYDKYMVETYPIMFKDRHMKEGQKIIGTMN